MRFFYIGYAVVTIGMRAAVQEYFPIVYGSSYQPANKQSRAVVPDLVQSIVMNVAILQEYFPINK